MLIITYNATILHNLDITFTLIINYAYPQRGPTFSR